MKVNGTTWLEVGFGDLFDAQVCVELTDRNEVRLAVLDSVGVEVSSSYVTRARALALAALLVLAALTPWLGPLRFWWLRRGRPLVTGYAERCRKWLALLIGPERKRGSSLSTTDTASLRDVGRRSCGHVGDNSCKTRFSVSESVRGHEHRGRLNEVERG